MLRRDRPGEGALQGQCYENKIPGLNVHKPGTYRLWLSDMDIRPISSVKTIYVKGLLLPWTIEFTQEDIERGIKNMTAPPGGLFRVTVVDGRHVPIPNHKLLAGADEITAELQMDASGSLLMYGNPTQCFILIDSGFGIYIEHLDTVGL
jgi:hypothetical protein